MALEATIDRSTCAVETDTALKLLIIDDDKKSYNLIRHLLTETTINPSTIDWVATYNAGLKAMAENKYDIFLIDYLLDTRTGLDLIREAVKLGCCTPLIMLTGYESQEVGLKAIEAGAADYLLKNEIQPQLIERSIRYSIERKRVEQALRESEALLRQIIDLLPHMIFAKDKQGRVLLANQATAEMFGTSINELVGAYYEEVQQDKAKAKEELAADLEVIRTGEPKVRSHENFVDTRGDHHVLQVTKIPFNKSGNRERAVLEAAVDITDRVRAESALQEAHNRLEERVAVRTAELAAANEKLKAEIAEKQRLEQRIHDSLKRRTLQVLTSTEIAQKIADTPKLDELFFQIVSLVQQQFGYYHVHVYTLEEDYLLLQEGTGGAGQMMKQVGYKIPLNSPRSTIARAAQLGEPVLVTDVSKTPDWLPNSLMPETKAEIAVPIKLSHDVLGVLDVQNNAIDSLDEEDEIMLMGLCGQIAVAINNCRLESEQKKAEEVQKRLFQELNAFAHTIGYTLRDPVSLIIGYADLLKSQAGLPDNLQEYLNAIARNGLKMGNIIDELQMLSGVRKATVELRPLNMARVVAEVQDRLSHLIQEYQAKIIISEYWPIALGHKPWVEEVWANYLSNAIKHGGTPPYVQLGATAQSDGMIRFWVRDNGPGFTKAETARMFSEFASFSQGRVTEYSLGLAIVKRIITKLEGQVRVESDGIPGAGSIFSFSLPKA